MTSVSYIQCAHPSPEVRALIDEAEREGIHRPVVLAKEDGDRRFVAVVARHEVAEHVAPHIAAKVSEEPPTPAVGWFVYGEEIVALLNVEDAERIRKAN